MANPEHLKIIQQGAEKWNEWRKINYKPDLSGGRIGKGISAQALHRTVLEILTSHGSSHSA